MRDDSQFCAKCGSWIHTQPGSASYSREFRYVGFWPRFIAWFIDGIIVNLGVLVPAFILGLIVGISMAGQPQDEIKMTAGVLGYILGILTSWLYFSLMESSQYQATLGKQVIGAVVVNTDGGRLSFGQAAGRWFGKIVSGFAFGLGFIWIGISKTKQGFHDTLAHTYVIYKRVM